MIVGWILIGICCFYLVRNLYVGYVMFPCGKHILMTHNDVMTVKRLKLFPAYRNYYLLVLNPLWWRFLDIYKNDADGRKIKMLWKQFCVGQKNLRNLK